jgi:hypothetical protein
MDYEILGRFFIRDCEKSRQALSKLISFGYDLGAYGEIEDFLCRFDAEVARILMPQLVAPGGVLVAVLGSPNSDFDLREMVAEVLRDQGETDVLAAIQSLASCLEIETSTTLESVIARWAFKDLLMAEIAEAFEWFGDVDYENWKSHISRVKSVERSLSQTPRLDWHTAPNGEAITRDDYYDDWLEIRRRSVSATDARKLIKQNGLPSLQVASLLKEKSEQQAEFSHWAFERGIEREPIIADWVTRNFPEYRFEASSRLYKAAISRHVATPDMIGIDTVCEIKVSSKPLAQIRNTYSDQVQWQLYVTGASKALFVVENRYSEGIEYMWIPRDESRIKALVRAADAFLLSLDENL